MLKKKTVTVKFLRGVSTPGKSYAGGPHELPEKVAKQWIKAGHCERVVIPKKRVLARKG